MQRVVVCGKGLLSLKILKLLFENRNSYSLEAFVPSINEEKNSPADWENNEIREFCLENKINFVESGSLSELLEDDKKENNYDLLVVAFYKKLILKKQLDKFRLAINIHLSELPKYRGARGINWALKNEELYQGVTIHVIDEYLDHGAIISQNRFSIYHEFEEVLDVYERSLEYAYLLFKTTLPNLSQIIPKEQNHKLSTYYSSKDFKNLGERYTFTKKESLKKNFN